MRHGDGCRPHAAGGQISRKRRCTAIDVLSGIAARLTAPIDLAVTKDMSYIDRLIASCLAAKQARPTREVDGADPADLDGIQKAIYVIEEVGGDPQETFMAFSRYKKKKERACAKLNAPSSVLYVGSSATGVKKRIEQHMGQGHKGTYALHLSHWFRGTYKVTVRQYDVSDEVLQILEDELSDRIKPAFGKQGGNNR